MQKQKKRRARRIRSPVLSAVKAARERVSLVILKLTNCGRRGQKARDAHLGRLCGVTENSFGDIRLGRRNLSPARMAQLSKALGRDAQFIELSVFTAEGRSGCTCADGSHQKRRKK